MHIALRGVSGLEGWVSSSLYLQTGIQGAQNPVRLEPGPTDMHSDGDRAPSAGCGLDAADKTDGARLTLWRWANQGGKGREESGMGANLPNAHLSLQPEACGLRKQHRSGQRASQIPALLRIQLRHRLLPNLETQETLATAMGTPRVGSRQKPHLPAQFWFVFLKAGTTKSSVSKLDRVLKEQHLMAHGFTYNKADHRIVGTWTLEAEQVAWGVS